MVRPRFETEWIRFFSSEIGRVRTQALGGKVYLEPDAIPRFGFGELRGWRGINGDYVIWSCVSS